MGGLLTLALLLIFVFVFLLLMALYFKRAFDSLAERSGEQLFHNAGSLLFIGAILTIFFLIGLIPIFIGWIIATIAFFSLKTTPTQPYSQQPYVTRRNRQCRQHGSAQLRSTRRPLRHFLSPLRTTTASAIKIHPFNFL